MSCIVVGLGFLRGVRLERRRSPQPGGEFARVVAGRAGEVRVEVRGHSGCTEGRLALVTVSKSMCRICTAHCPVLVTVTDGVVTEVKGDRASPLFEGYTCPKGRALPAIHAHPDRLLHSLRRRPDGSHEPIRSEEAVAEIADRLADIVDRHGPDSVALYIGSSNVAHPTVGRLAGALLQALGLDQRVLGGHRSTSPA